MSQARKGPPSLVVSFGLCLTGGRRGGCRGAPQTAPRPSAPGRPWRPGWPGWRGEGDEQGDWSEHCRSCEAAATGTGSSWPGHAVQREAAADASLHECMHRLNPQHQRQPARHPQGRPLWTSVPWANRQGMPKRLPSLHPQPPFTGCRGPSRTRGPQHLENKLSGNANYPL